MILDMFECFLFLGQSINQSKANIFQTRECSEFEFHRVASDKFTIIRLIS